MLPSNLNGLSVPWMFCTWLQQFALTSFSVKTSLWSLSVSDDDSGSEICREYPDNPSDDDDSDERGESGSEIDGEGGGDWARYSVMSYMVEEILRPGDTGVPFRTVLESWMFLKVVSIRSTSLTLRSNGESPRLSQILENNNLILIEHQKRRQLSLDS